MRPWPGGGDFSHTVAVGSDGNIVNMQTQIGGGRGNGNGKDDREHHCE
jgi:hypothetical protein